MVYTNWRKFRAARHDTKKVAKPYKRPADYKESGDSRDKTQMTVKTLEGTKSYGRRKANKKSAPSKVFSSSVNREQRSRVYTRARGRT